MKFKIWASIERENDAGEMVDVNPHGLPVSLGEHATWKKARQWLEDHLPAGAYSILEERPVVMPKDPKPHRTFKIHEVDSIYVEPGDRFIVSLVVGFDSHRGSLKGFKQALRNALKLTRGEGVGGTRWHVHDRKTGQSVVMAQHEVDP